MKLGRIFANAIVRRLACLLVALVLAWMGLGDAKAATQSEALAECQANATSWLAVSPSNRRNAKCTRSGLSYVLTGESWVGHWSESTLGTYYFTNTCPSNPSSTFSHDLQIPTGSVGCSGGCEYVVTSNGDGTFQRNFSTPGLQLCDVLPDCPTSPDWYLNHVTGLCTPVQEECPANQSKNPHSGQCEEACPTGMVLDHAGVCKPSKDDCPAGNTRAPSGECLPGEGQCAAGEARRPNGTCGKDSDGDGVADDDDDDPENDSDKETFSGGDNCNSPPSCSGGPIDCGMARIQWRIDCNTRRSVNITGGTCGAMPICVGDNCKAMEYAQLMQQWKAACALEKLANAEPGEPGEGGDNQDLIDLLTGPGSINGTYGDTGGMPGADGFEFGQTDIPEPDTSGMGYGSSCPSPPSFSVYGQTISINLTPMCNWVGLAGNLVLILAALASMRIVSGSTA